MDLGDGVSPVWRRSSGGATRAGSGGGGATRGGSSGSGSLEAGSWQRRHGRRPPLAVAWRAGSQIRVALPSTAHGVRPLSGGEARTGRSWVRRWQICVDHPPAAVRHRRGAPATAWHGHEECAWWWHGRRMGRRRRALRSRRAHRWALKRADQWAFGFFIS